MSSDQTNQPGTLARVTFGRMFRWSVAASCGVAAVLVGAYAVYTVRAVLIRVFIALFIAMSLDPAVRWLTRHRVRRSYAVTIIFLMALGLITAFIWSVIPPLVNQVSNLIDDLPSYAKTLSEKSETYKDFVERYQLTQKITDFLGGLPAKIGPNAINIAQRFFTAIFNSLLIVVLTIYFMADLPRIRGGIVRIAPPASRKHVGRAVNVVVDKVGAYMIGNLIISLVAGISTYIFLALVEVPFALPMAFFVAITDLIPLIGATVGAAGCVLVSAFTVSLWPKTVIVLIFFIAYQQVENYYIAPRVLRNTVNLSSIAVLLAALLGGTLLGAVGAVMAIPVVAAVKVLMATSEEEPPVPSEDDGHPDERPGSAADAGGTAEGSVAGD